MPGDNPHRKVTMKFFFLPMIFILAFSTMNISAAVRYVDVNGTNPLAPYTSWATAATNIQDAINEAEAGDTVLVTNGIYQSGAFPELGSNRVYLVKSLTVQSVNGPAVTVIRGYQVPGTNAVRCVFMSAGVLSGFTLTNGATLSNGDYFGGGVYCSSTSCIVSNCIITGNCADSGGGGANSGTLVNCILSGNTAGVFQSNGGGAARDALLINCLLTQNFSASVGGAAYECTLLNCTVVSNSTAEDAGSLFDCTVKNTIAYYNFNDYTNADLASGNAYTNCCLSFTNYFAVNSFTNPPLFVNPAAGNYRLLPWSPCINAGNNSFITNTTDLADNPRIVGGTVDIGAYEFQSPLHFVGLTGTNPVAPFSSWLTAATNIQDAIDAANGGDLIVVSNGLYQSGATLVGQDTLPNRIVIGEAVTVQSVNGPASTIIAGNGAGNGASTGIRCAYLANGAVLSGFTLTNGATQNSEYITNDENGGGVWCQSDSVVVTNCILTGNHAFADGGAAYQGTFDNCLIISNVANVGGGGLFACVANNTLISSNLAQDGKGGGVYSNVLNNCVLQNNRALLSGGGAYGSVLANCAVLSNIAGNAGGGLFACVASSTLISSNVAGGGNGGGAYSNVLNNCVLQYNRTSASGGGAYGSTMVNCTVVSNTASDGGGVEIGQATNSIVFGNYSLNNGNPNWSGSGSLMSYCDTIPLPESGFGNITNDPVFVNPGANNFSLQSNSPCINSGDNLVVTSSTDFAGNPRIVGGTVDIGTYESQTPTSIIGYAWLQQYGLPTDGSVDFADLDGTGLNVDQDWIAGLNPTNPASVLALLPPVPAHNTNGVTVTWQSVKGINYFIQLSSNLTVQPAFTTIQSNLVGQAGSTSYTDTNAVGTGPYFYRVGVQ